MNVRMIKVCSMISAVSSVRCRCRGSFFSMFWLAIIIIGSSQ